MEPLPEQAVETAQRKLAPGRIVQTACNLLPELAAIVASYIVWDLRCLRVGDVIEARAFLGEEEWYLATITEIQPLAVHVHFLGWSSLYDEWISQFCGRFIVANPWASHGRQPTSNCSHSDDCHCLMRTMIREPTDYWGLFCRRMSLQVGDQIVVDHRPAIVQTIAHALGTHEYYTYVTFPDGSISIHSSSSCRCSACKISSPLTT